MKNLAFHSALLKLKDDYCTNSHYVTCDFSSKYWENVLFELGSERVKLQANAFHRLPLSLKHHVER